MIGGSIGGNGRSDGDRVRLRLTVVDPARAGAQIDVEISAAAATPLGAVAPQLLAGVGRPPGAGGTASLFVDGAPVDDAVLGLPPLLQGAVVTVGRGGGPPGRGSGTRGGLAEVHVVSGPDAGTRLPLAQGATRVGRGCEAGLRVADPDVSRVHAEIVATGTAVQVRDLGSTNGTRLAATPVGSTPVSWPPDDLLELGGSVLALRPVDTSAAGGGGAASTVPDGSGRLLVNPAPRLRPPPVGGVVTYPEPPSATNPPRLPWPALLLPLLLSVPLAWWLHEVVFLAFALLSPVMMLGQYLFDRRERSGERARASARYTAELDQARALLAGLLDAERTRLLIDHPDPAAIGATASGPRRRLWERHPDDDDVAVLRLGVGDRRPAVELRGPPPPDDPPPLLADVPVSIDLADPAVGGVAGLAGPRREVLALARALLGQAAVLCSPRHLRIVVLTSDGDPDRDWVWAARLPHASGDLPAAPQDDDQRPVGGGAPGGPRVLLVLDGAARLRRDPQVAALLAGAGARLQALCLDDEPARLPAECGAIVDVAAAGATPGAVVTSRGDEPRPLRPDLVSPAWAERLARDLARLADATPAGPSSALPDQVRLLDLLAPDGLDVRTTVAGWSAGRQAGERATSTPIGRTATGPWQLDLARQGPHVLVAGTTGAGKSELLTTLIAGLAARHPPDRVNLLLVDYKGGTAFGPLADLPHAAGVLTDLDEHLARRALASLRAELRRREAQLRAVGAADVDGYDRVRRPGDPPMPRLVIVVDEFRVLAEELPDLLAGLVRVAVVGRSLGVHLVLATQRPAGVVTAEIRANVNLRIALRVRDRIDSEDVVEAPDAALLPAGAPGRGLYRVGGGPLVEFQTARATGRPVTAAEPASVRRVRPDRRVATAWAVTPIGRTATGTAHAGAAHAGAAPGAGPDDLAVLVAVCRAAALEDGAAPARAPWLPPLPSVIRPADVPALLAGSDPPEPDPPSSDRPTTAGGPVLTIGVADLPERQARAPLHWALAREGHLAVLGAPGTGRTGIVRAIVGAVGRCHEPVHVHVVDGGGLLGELEGLPRVGAVVPAADTERAGRLLAKLGERARRRRPGEPPVVLLVDGWEQVVDAWLPADHGRLVDDLVRLARGGAAAEFRMAVTGGRSLLSGPIAGLLTERLLLRATDPTDLVMAGAPADALPARMPPGRVLRIGPGGGAVEAQLLLDDPVADAPPGRPCPEEPAPIRVAALPGHVSTAALLAAAQTRAGGGTAALLSAGSLPLGLGGDEASPLGPPASGPGWLVAGAPGSGRSTTLAAAAEVLVAARRDVVVVAAAPSPLAVLATRLGRDVVAPRALRTGSVDLLAELDDRPRATLLVDDLSALADTLVEDGLITRLDEAATGADLPESQAPDEPQAPAEPQRADERWPTGPGPHVLGGCTPGQAAVAFRGLAARLRGTGAAVLQTPVAAGDGEAFGVRLSAVPEVTAGRALLVTGSTVRAVQIAEPGTGSAGPGRGQPARLGECGHD